MNKTKTYIVFERKIQYYREQLGEYEYLADVDNNITTFYPENAEKFEDTPDIIDFLQKYFPTQKMKGFYPVRIELTVKRLGEELFNS